MTTPTSPLLTLNNGVQMPALGLGVFQSTREQTAGAVETAIGAGYRLIDTAAAYANEAQVGEGIRRSGIDRAELFVTTKLWMSDHGHDATLRAFDASLRRLGLDYLDLYLVHWPVPADWERTLDSWRAMEKLLADGRVRAIGVCNHHPHHLEDLVRATDVVPAVNQVELHPFFNQPRVRAANAKLGVVTQSWSPIGGGRVYNAGTPDAPHSPLEHPTITGLAQAYGKTPAQVVIRWHLQHGLSVIPKSVRPERITENIDVFDFELTVADMAAIDALTTGVRAGADPEVVDQQLFGVTIDND
ncbi:aldo/keto reductase [Pseudonocardia nigra]|uniref:aldo/keto reductase n=1 Tax=Pseudonocardia nigra TaxID=1921578 RepID=UPI001C5EE74E|nr:aldo/keto reductase [Pseudonocardia nigra]